MKATQNVLALLAGLVFSAGLLLSGMAQPEKVLGFLDVGGRWDASLLLVMGGAVAVHFTAKRLARRRAAPLWSASFALPTRRDIDARLLIGAALFGVGWGLGGYCPGAALVSLPLGGAGVLVFVSAMIAGLLLGARLERAGAALPAAAAAAPDGAPAALSRADG